MEFSKLWKNNLDDLETGNTVLRRQGGIDCIMGNVVLLLMVKGLCPHNI